MAEEIEDDVPFAVNVPLDARASGQQRLKKLSTNVLSKFFPPDFVRELVDADELDAAQRERCVETVRGEFQRNSSLRRFLRESVSAAQKELVQKDFAKATRLKDAGNVALQRGRLKLAWERYTTALRFAPHGPSSGDDRDWPAKFRRLVAVVHHNRSLALMQYSKMVVAMSTSGTLGMTEDSERALIKVLLGVLLDAAEAVVADPTYAKGWHRLYSAMETVDMRLRVAGAGTKVSQARDHSIASVQGAEAAQKQSVHPLLAAVRQTIDMPTAKEIASVLLDLRHEHTAAEKNACASRAGAIAEKLELLLEDDQGPWPSEAQQTNIRHSSADDVGVPVAGFSTSTQNEEPPFALRRSEQKGKYVVATQHLKAGSVVLSDLPFGFVRTQGRLSCIENDAALVSSDGTRGTSPRPVVAPDQGISVPPSLDSWASQNDRCDWCLTRSYAPLPDRHAALFIFCSRVCRRAANRFQIQKRSLVAPSSLLPTATCLALRVASRLYPEALLQDASAVVESPIPGPVEPRLLPIGSRLPDKLLSPPDTAVKEVYLMKTGHRCLGALIFSNGPGRTARHVLQMSVVLAPSASAVATRDDACDLALVALSDASVAHCSVSLDLEREHEAVNGRASGRDREPLAHTNHVTVGDSHPAETHRSDFFAGTSLLERVVAVIETQNRTEDSQAAANSVELVATLSQMIQAACCKHLFASEDGSGRANGSRIRCDLRRPQTAIRDPSDSESFVHTLPNDDAEDDFEQNSFGVVAAALLDCGFQLEATLRGAVGPADHGHDDLGAEEHPVEDALVFGLLRSDIVTTLARTASNSDCTRVVVLDAPDAQAEVEAVERAFSSRRKPAPKSLNTDQDDWWRTPSRNILPASDIVECMVDNLDRLHGIMFLDRSVQAALLEWLIAEGASAAENVQSPSFQVLLSLCSKIHCNSHVFSNVVQPREALFYHELKQGGDIDDARDGRSGQSSPLGMASVETVHHSRMAIALYPYAALLNHSCAPNCVAEFLVSSPQLVRAELDNGTGNALLARMNSLYTLEDTACGELVRSGMCIRTLTDVAPGEELCISYGPLRENATFDRRRAALAPNYCFECRCSACIAEEQQQPAFQGTQRVTVHKPQAHLPTTTASIESVQEQPRSKQGKKGKTKKKAALKSGFLNKGAKKAGGKKPKSLGDKQTLLGEEGEEKCQDDTVASGAANHSEDGVLSVVGSNCNLPAREIQGIVDRATAVCDNCRRTLESLANTPPNLSDPAAKEKYVIAVTSVETALFETQSKIELALSPAGTSQQSLLAQHASTSQQSGAKPPQFRPADVPPAIVKVLARIYDTLARTQTMKGSWNGAAVWCRMAVEFLGLILPPAAPELAMERFKLAQLLFNGQAGVAEVVPAVDKALSSFQAWHRGRAPHPLESELKRMKAMFPQ